MLILLELAIAAGAGAVAINWWLAWRREQREADPTPPEPPPPGAQGRLRWLLKEGRLTEAAQDANQRLFDLSTPKDEPSAGRSSATDELQSDLQRALDDVRSQRAATPDADALSPLSRDERQLIAHGNRLQAVRAYIDRTGSTLDEAMAIVSRLASTLHEAPEYKLSPTEQRLLIEGNVITVIKLVRERTGLSLLKAKELVERSLKELDT
jgi:hypothetical protein